MGSLCLLHHPHQLLHQHQHLPQKLLQPPAVSLLHLLSQKVLPGVLTYIVLCSECSCLCLLGALLVLSLCNQQLSKCKIDVEF